MAVILQTGSISWPFLKAGHCSVVDGRFDCGHAVIQWGWSDRQ